MESWEETVGHVTVMVYPDPFFNSAEGVMDIPAENVELALSHVPSTSEDHSTLLTPPSSPWQSEMVHVTLCPSVADKASGSHRHPESLGSRTTSGAHSRVSPPAMESLAMNVPAWGYSAYTLVFPLPEPVS